jgi:toxin ParE1/3/4
MKLHYSPAARQQIQAIYDYITERNPAAAKRVVARIRAAAAHLRAFPYSGRFGVVPDTHEWVVRGLSYILVYEVRPDDDAVVVMAVFHGAQGRPRRPGPGE